jgi:hypothetical protein
VRLTAVVLLVITIGAHADEPAASDPAGWVLLASGFLLSTSGGLIAHSGLDDCIGTAAECKDDKPAYAALGFSLVGIGAAAALAGSALLIADKVRRSRAQTRQLSFVLRF